MAFFKNKFINYENMDFHACQLRCLTWRSQLFNLTNEYGKLFTLVSKFYFL